MFSSRSDFSRSVHDRAVPFITNLALALLLLLFAGCGGKGKSANSPANVGGGYTLVVSGGTLNDGSGVKGLSILATLRNAEGWGPTQTWTIKVSGPDISPTDPLVVDYFDPRVGSYMSWEWAGFNPSPGTYRATATNGIVTIYYDFSVNSTVIQHAAPNTTSSGGDISLSWPAVSGAGCYFYEVCSPTSSCRSGVTTTTSAVASFGTLSTGDYLIQVKAFATDRPALYANHTASPSLALNENVSEYLFSFPIGGDQISSNYSFGAAGGVLDYGLSGPGGGIYGLAIWTSLQDTTSPGNPAAPAGNWNINITDPHGTIINYIYPAGERHDANWYYGIEPVSAGTYTVTATYGSAVKTAAFSLADTSPGLAPLSVTDISSDISAALVSNATNTSVNDISISWTPVSGAKSYYVSLYTEIWNNATKQYDYDEVWSQWVNAASARVLNGGVAPGLVCDVYVTAYQVDMTSAAPPASSPTRADMSENYYGYTLPFVTP